MVRSVYWNGNHIDSKSQERERYGMAQELISQIARTLGIRPSLLRESVELRSENSGEFSAAFITVEIHKTLPPSSVKPVDAGVFLYLLLSEETGEEEREELKACIERLPEGLKRLCQNFMQSRNAKHTSPPLAETSDATFAVNPA